MQVRESYGRELVNLRNESRFVFLNTLFSVSEAVLYMQARCSPLQPAVHAVVPMRGAALLGGRAVTAGGLAWPFRRTPEARTKLHFSLQLRLPRRWWTGWMPT